MPVSALSRGEGQRVGLARALVLRPEILICDDVFSGLDWRTRDGIVGFFEELREALNLTIVVCTASPEIAMRAANRLLILEHGDCIATGTPSEIRDMEDPVVRKVFLSHIEAMQRFGNVSGASGEAGRP
jgi:ABC-type multidrug transport system ATPase subunit